jgi:hypothetical protein
VIGAGFGRSGTTLLRAALHRLGYQPCYHMQSAMTHYAHLKFWVRAKAIAVYEAHRDEVRRSVPAERLLEFNVNEGWAPLCAFLGKPVAENVPFPHLNDRVFFRRVILALRLATWLLPVSAVVALVWVGFILL